MIDVRSVSSPARRPRRAACCARTGPRRRADRPRVYLPSPAGEDAVGAEVDQTDAAGAQSSLQPMRQQRVDLEAHERLFGIVALLDDADAVDHRLGVAGADRGVEPLRIPDIDLEVAARPFQQAGIAAVCNPFLAQRCMHLVSRSQAVDQLVSEHAVAAENENLHSGRDLARPGRQRP